MSAHHGHDHHHHGHRCSANKKRLALTLCLAATYLIAEVVGGLLTNSLALLADAGHMVSDVMALALSYFAVWMADKPSPSHKTYGYHRAEILAALANGAGLVAISIYIFVEAIQRFRQPAEVLGATMMWIAIGGLIINLLCLVILHGGRDESLNIRGAWLHVLTDALGSVGAIAAGILIWQFGWTWADPTASVAIGILVVISSWRLLAESVSVLMENAPKGMNVDEVHTAMFETPGVTGVHSLHVWTITSGLDSLSAHVVAADGQQHRELLQQLRTMLHDRFGIDHITIQIEPEGFEEAVVSF